MAHDGWLGAVLGKVSIALNLIVTYDTSYDEELTPKYHVDPHTYIIWKSRFSSSWWFIVYTYKVLVLTGVATQKMKSAPFFEVSSIF